MVPAYRLKKLIVFEQSLDGKELTIEEETGADKEEGNTSIIRRSTDKNLIQKKRGQKSRKQKSNDFKIS